MEIISGVTFYAALATDSMASEAESAVKAVKVSKNVKAGVKVASTSMKVAEASAKLKETISHFNSTQAKDSFDFTMIKNLITTIFEQCFIHGPCSLDNTSKAAMGATKELFEDFISVLIYAMKFLFGVDMESM